MLFPGTWDMSGLSPELFALALEPLAILLRANPGVKGIVVGPLEEKLSLYADDTLLYLADAYASLHSMLTLFDQFSRYPGICINWDKLVLFPLHPSVPCIDTHTPQWVDKFTYCIRESGYVATWTIIWRKM